MDEETQRLYFLTKAQIINICIKEKAVLNSTENLLSSLATKLNEVDEQLKDVQDQNASNDKIIKENRQKIKVMTNTITFSNSEEA